MIIGRDGVDIVVSDEEVSRRHAAVRPVPEGVEVEDLGSSNGTFVDGRRVQGAVTITQAADVQVGSATLHVTVALPQATVARRVPSAPDLTVRRATIPAASPAAAAAEPPAQPAQPQKKGGPPVGVLVGAGVAVVAAAVVVVLLLSGGSSTVASKPNPNCDRRFPTVINDGFPEPPLVFSRNGSLSTKLTATPTTVRAPGETARGFQYNGGTPGPMWVICRGDRLNVDLQNKLPLSSNLHVHGLHVDPDGKADNVFLNLKPLRTHSYSYDIAQNQSPGTFWYHPHWHPFVDPQTNGGMLGGIIVEGGLDERLADVPQRLIMIHGGRVASPDGKALPIPGVKPGTIKPPPTVGPKALLVNGTFQPTLHIQPGQVQRWRLWNATGDRFVRLELPGATLNLLALDGNTLRDMLPRKQLLLGPGERAEVLVQGGEAGSYSLEMRGFQQCFKGCFDPFAAVPANGRDLGSQRLINIDDSGTPVNDTLPTGTLANPEDLRKRPVAIRRTLNLTREPQQGKAPHYPINDKLFDDRRVDVTMKLDDVEEWTIKSPDTALASEWHNFHIHTNAFQVIAVNGKPLDRVQWQDTVNVPPNGSVTILMRPTDFVGTAVFHCHLDFHEDNGMMGVFRIAKDPTPAEVNANKIMFLRPMHHLSHARLASVSGAQHAVPGTNQSLLGRAAYLCRLAV